MSVSICVAELDAWVVVSTVVAPETLGDHAVAVVVSNLAVVRRFADVGTAEEKEEEERVQHILLKDRRVERVSIRCVGCAIEVRV